MSAYFKSKTGRVELVHGNSDDGNLYQLSPDEPTEVTNSRDVRKLRGSEQAGETEATGLPPAKSSEDSSDTNVLVEEPSDDLKTELQEMEWSNLQSLASDKDLDVFGKSRDELEAELVDVMG